MLFPTGLLALALLGLTSATTYRDCGSVDGQVSSVSVSGCGNSVGRCVLQKGTNATITINFSSKVKSDAVTVVVKGVIGGIPLPFNFPQSNGCQNSNLQCPLSSGTDYSYQQALEIKTIYPSLDVDIKFQLVDSANQDIACVLIPATLK